MNRNTLLNVKQVAAYLQLKESTVYTWAQEGKIPAIKIGRTWRFRRSDLDAWLAAQKVGPQEDDAAKNDMLLNIKQVARYLRMKESAIARWAQQGLIPAFKAEGEWQFRRSELDAWLARHLGSTDETPQDAEEPRTRSAPQTEKRGGVSRQRHEARQEHGASAKEETEPKDTPIHRTPQAPHEPSRARPSVERASDDFEDFWAMSAPEMGEGTPDAFRGIEVREEPRASANKETERKDTPPISRTPQAPERPSQARPSAERTSDDVAPQGQPPREAQHRTRPYKTSERRRGCGATALGLLLSGLALLTAILGLG